MIVLHVKPQVSSFKSRDTNDTVLENTLTSDPSVVPHEPSKQVTPQEEINSIISIVDYNSDLSEVRSDSETLLTLPLNKDRTAKGIREQLASQPRDNSNFDVMSRFFTNTPNSWLSLIEIILLCLILFGIVYFIYKNFGNVFKELFEKTWDQRIDQLTGLQPEDKKLLNKLINDKQLNTVLRYMPKVIQHCGDCPDMANYPTSGMFKGLEGEECIKNWIWLTRSLLLENRTENELFKEMYWSLIGGNFEYPSDPNLIHQRFWKAMLDSSELSKKDKEGLTKIFETHSNVKKLITEMSKDYTDKTLCQETTDYQIFEFVFRPCSPGNPNSEFWEEIKKLLNHDNPNARMIGQICKVYSNSFEPFWDGLIAGLRKADNHFRKQLKTAQTN